MKCGALAGRFLLGGAFTYAGMVKLRAPQDFADAIAAYQLLPAPLIVPFALALPVFEILCGVLVLTGFCFRPGVLGILAMLVLFGAALGLANWRGLSVDCGCYGPGAWLDGRPVPALWRDLLLLVLASWLYAGARRERNRFGPQRAAS